MAIAVHTNLRPLLATSVLCITLGGCTSSISSSKLTHEGGIGDSPGIVYHLATTELHVKFNYELLQCDDEVMKVAISSVDLESVNKADRAEEATYVIDIDDATDWSKNVPNFKVALADGLLTSIDYAVTDRTDTIIQNVAQTLRSLGLGIPLPAPPIQPPVPPAAEAEEIVCAEETVDALDQLKAWRKAAGNVYNRIRKSSADSDLVGMLASLEAIDKRIEKLRTHLTATWTGRFLPTKDHVQKDLEAEPSIFMKWLRSMDERSMEKLKGIVVGTAVTVELLHAPKVSGAAAQGKAIFYRIPRPVEVVVKWKPPRRQEVPEIDHDFVLLRHDVQLYQFGTVVPLVMDNDVLQRNQYRVAFTSGEPAVFSYAESLEQIGNVAQAESAAHGAQKGSDNAGGAPKGSDNAGGAQNGGDNAGGAQKGGDNAIERAAEYCKEQIQAGAVPAEEFDSCVQKRVGAKANL